MVASHTVTKMFWVILLLFQNVISSDVKKFSLLMPDVHPNREELYLCTPVKIVEDKYFYIVGFEPNATMNTVHHMILFGCAAPGSTKPVWDCGEMADTSDDFDSNLIKSRPCSEGSQVLYAWARDAKTLTLPEDVGFKIGQDTEVAYLVLQVHYARKFPKYYVDNSGINLLYTETPKSKLAGTLLLATGGTVAPQRVTFMDSFCKIEEDKVIHPFAYRVHTHSLGKVVSGYIARRDERMEYEWILLGKRDPLTPQMFYPTFTNEPIRKGDVVASRCTMESHRDYYTNVGQTNKDEMCNFYIMYYVENDIPLEMKYCVTMGPPQDTWSNSRYHFNNIPEIDSSTL